MAHSPDSPLRAQSAALLESNPCRGVKADHLAEVLAAATLRRLGDGDPLCTEGEPGDSMFFLVDGNIRVQRRDAAGRMRELAIMKAPDLVGHMSLVDHSPRSASCVAVGRTVVASLDRRTYNNLLTEPSHRGTALRRLLLASLTRQLAGANDRIRDLIDGPEAKAGAAKAAGSRDRGHQGRDLGTGTGHKAASPNYAAGVEDFDVSQSDLMRVAGVLDGWKVDARGADKMKVVYDEDQRRNPKAPHLKR